MTQIFTTTVFSGDCCPYVYIAERKVSATLDDGSLVVTQANSKPLVVQEGEYFASREEAVADAIVKLEQLKAKAIAEIDRKIEVVKKTYLQAQPIAV